MPKRAAISAADALTASAVYHRSASGGGDVLHVQASSSDGQLAPTSLTVASCYNKALGAKGSVDIPTLAPPDQVTVTSSKGGSVTVPVAIDGAGLAALPPRADAGVDQTVDQGAKVTLDGGGSAGDIDSMSWSAPAGVTLTGATTATPTFTAPTTAGKLTFTLTVTGNGQTQTDSVDVTVKQTGSNTDPHYQIDFRGQGDTIAPGATGATRSQLFAGAKVVKLIDAYE